MIMAATPSQAAIDLQKDRLRLWIKLIRVTRSIESELRDRLRREFNETMPRFDVMAALYRCPDGMMMSELSRSLMVSNANVTPIIERLVQSRMVSRTQRHGDRRSLIVSLSRQGRKHFKAMAEQHQQWVNELLGELDPDQIAEVSHQLSRVSSTLQPSTP